MVQIMPYRLFGAKLLTEPVLNYCKLDPQEQISVQFELEYKHFHKRRRI